MRNLGALLGLLLLASRQEPLSTYCERLPCPGFREANELVHQAARSGCTARLIRGRCGDLDFLQAGWPGESKRAFFAPDGGVVAVRESYDGEAETWIGEPIDCRPRVLEDLCAGGPTDGGGTNPLSLWCARHPCRTFSDEVQTQKEAPADGGCFYAGACGSLLYLEERRPSQFDSVTRYYSLRGELVGVNSTPDLYLETHFGQVPACTPNLDETTCEFENRSTRPAEPRPLAEYCKPGTCPTYFEARFAAEQADRWKNESVRSAVCGEGHLLVSSDGFVLEELYFGQGGALVSARFEDDTGVHKLFGPPPTCRPGRWFDLSAPNKGFTRKAALDGGVPGE